MVGRWKIYPRGKMKIKLNENLVLTYADDGRLEKIEKPLDKVEVYINDNGSKFWHKNGKQHRGGDKPAAIDFKGGKYWIKNGKIHRDNDKPAVINSNGSKEWWVNGKMIREEKEEK